MHCALEQLIAVLSSADVTTTSYYKGPRSFLGTPYRRLAMVFFPSFLSAIAKSGAQVAAAAGPIPGLGAVGEIITAIILLCDAVPQNRYSPISIPRFFHSPTRS